MGVRLPAEYQEVEYLRSTGGQIIAVRNVGRTEFDVSITTDVYWENVTKRQLHGADTRRYFGIVNGYYQVNQTGTSTTDLVAVINQWQHVVFSRAGSVCTLKVDSDEREVTSAASASASMGFCLFGIGQSNSYNCLCRLKRTLVEIEDDHYDFIPCYRKTDSKPGMYDLVSGEFHTNQGTGEFIVGPDVIDSISPLMVAWRRIMMAAASVAKKLTKLIVTSTTGLASFNTNVEMPMKTTCEFSPVQEGTGDPSPDNVRPISGWTGCNIFNCEDSFYNNTGLTYGAAFTTVTVLASDAINVKATSANYPSSKQLLSNYSLVNGKTYVIAADVEVTSGIGRIALRNSNNTVKSSSGAITESGYYYHIFTYDSSIMNYLSFFCNFSSSSSGDVTYRNIVFAEVNEQLPISWQSEAGTVYGGTVTLNEDGSADLVVDKAVAVFDSDGSGWQFGVSRGINYVIKNLQLVGANNNAIAYSHGGIRTRNSAAASYPGRNLACALPYNTETTYVLIGMSDDLTTKELCMEWIAETGPLQVLYNLATPQTYHFPNIGQLKSFLGENNIWHDMNGSITAEYWKKQ